MASNLSLVTPASLRLAGMPKLALSSLRTATVYMSTDVGASTGPSPSTTGNSTTANMNAVAARTMIGMLRLPKNGAIRKMPLHRVSMSRKTAA